MQSKGIVPRNVIVDYTLTPDKPNHFTLRTSHPKGNKEYLYSSDSSEIFWRFLGEEQWQQTYIRAKKHRPQKASRHIIEQI